MLLLALPASRGGLAITGNMTAAKTSKTPAAGLKDLLAITSTLAAISGHTPRSNASR